MFLFEYAICILSKLCFQPLFNWHEVYILNIQFSYARSGILCRSSYPELSIYHNELEHSESHAKKKNLFENKRKGSNTEKKTTESYTNRCKWVFNP